jgi:hypothetical protein
MPWSCILGESEFRESMAKLPRLILFGARSSLSMHFSKTYPWYSLIGLHSQLMTFESTMTGKRSPRKESEDVECAGHKVKYSLAKDHHIEHA